MDAEDVMARRWSDLSDRSRRLIIAAAIAEAILKTAVLIDIRRRPASQIRGSKRMWIVRETTVPKLLDSPVSQPVFQAVAACRKSGSRPRWAEYLGIVRSILNKLDTASVCPRGPPAGRLAGGAAGKGG